MKFFIAALFAVLVVAQATIYKHCKSDNDCSEGECCQDEGVFTRYGRCRYLKSEGIECDITGNIEQGVHDVCPCKKGLACIEEEYEFFGDKYLRNACRKPTDGN